MPSRSRKPITPADLRVRGAWGRPVRVYPTRAPIPAPGPRPPVKA